MELRATSFLDAEMMLQLLNTPDWIQYIGDRNVHSMEEAMAYITSRIIPQWENLGYGNFTVIEKKSGKKIGSCGLYKRPGLDIVDIGFAFFKEYVGKGYAFEAAQCVLKFGKSEFSIEKVGAITTKENYRSQKLIEKLGLKYQGLVVLPGETQELMYYES